MTVMMFWIFSDIIVPKIQWPFNYTTILCTEHPTRKGYKKTSVTLKSIGDRCP